MADNDRVILKGGWPTAVAAGSDDSVLIVNPHPYPVEVKKAYIVAFDALTADATNYTTLTLDNVTTDLFTARATTVGGTGFTANEVEEQTLLGVGSSLVVAAGAGLIFKKTDSGTGVAFSGECVLSCAPVRG